MKELKARLSIARTSDRTILIEVEDELSRTRMLELTVTPEEFALALTNLAGRPCEVLFNDSGSVGCRREHKRAEVFVPDVAKWSEHKAVAAAAVRAAESDGWSGSADDAQNMHCRVRREAGGTVYNVSFVRYVRPDGSPLRNDTDNGGV